MSRTPGGSSHPLLDERRIEAMRNLVSARGLVGVMSSGQGSISDKEQGSVRFAGDAGRPARHATAPASSKKPPFGPSAGEVAT